MTLREGLAKLDAVQKGRPFKIAASIVVLALALAAVIFYVVKTNAPADAAKEAAELVSPATDQASPEEKSAVESTSRIIRTVISGREDSTSVLVGAGVVAGISLAVIWLGLGLTYLALLTLGLAPALLLGWFQFDSPAWALGGVVVLTAAFTALMRLLKVLLGFSHPVTAVARNLLDEAARLKLSMIFIVMLIVGLALLPTTLDQSQPLRYRVQTFLSFSMGGSFWVTATLVVLFSVATVAFEQRDRVIWQTMTKPVAAWQYVLGKWIGVSALAAILLGVSGTGVFLFTEYLRSQPAQLEQSNRAYSIEDGGMSEDRFILETQVLSARVKREPEQPKIDEEQFRKMLNQMIDAELTARMVNMTDEEKAGLDAVRDELAGPMEKELRTAYQQQYRSIEPGASEIYRFEGLQSARDSNQPILLRFKANSGSNAPNEVYRITFEFRGGGIKVEEVALAQFQVIRLLPDIIDADGAIEVRVFNGDALTQIKNSQTLTFPPDGLEISFAASSFAANFARVMLVLWVKLVFLAILGIGAATFLSFPVACLVAFGAFLMAEGSGFLRSSLESFATASADGKEIYYFRVGVAAISHAVSWLFRTYSDLDPSRRAVEGVLLSWREVAFGMAVLVMWTAVLYMAAVLIFRRRELATYSGH